MYSKVLNKYFEQIDIYKSAIVTSNDCPDKDYIRNDLLNYDFPVKEFKELKGPKDVLDCRMYMLEVRDLDDFLDRIDFENLTIIFVLDEETYDEVNKRLVESRKIFKSFIIKI